MQANEIKAALVDALKETGLSLRQDLADVANYTAARTAVLALAVGQPGFELAVRAERDNVALFAGVSAVSTADAADQRVVGLIQGLLLAGAHALVV